ncbi:MAG TPA: 50S ribosomal protein L18 [Planctomycetota bacterium]|nr:50S ribosomal protein L18 [Planctomycetota bacterium]
MTSTSQKHQRRRGKSNSVRNKLRHVSTRPRLSVFRSLTNISVQIIDDLRGHTLVAASSQEKDLRGTTKGMRKTDVAKKVGSLVAERAKRAGVSKVAFDRGAYKYHGRIKALADAAREAGLEF